MGPRPQRWLSFSLLPFLLSFASAAFATLTNHTIDDTDPSVTSASLGSLCRNCDFTPAELVPLYNGSATSLNPPAPDESESTMVISFTGALLASWFRVSTYNIGMIRQGVAVYVYLAKPSGFPLNATFRLDDGNFRGTQFQSSSDIPRYNDSAFYAENLASGKHILKITRGQDASFYLDYYIYTSDDSVANPTSVSSLAISSFLGTSSTPSATSPLRASHAPSKSKVPVATIAGSVVGGIIFCVLLGVFLLCRRRRPPTTKSTAMVEPYATDTQAVFQPRTGVLPSTKGGSQTSPDGGNGNPIEMIRSLQENMQRLEQRLGEASLGEARGSTRFLSTGRRAVQDNRPTYNGTETFMHTDSGLRLTALGGERERVLEELPPTYEEN